MSKLKYNDGNVVCQVFNIVIQLANVAFARAYTVQEKTRCSLIEIMRNNFVSLEGGRIVVSALQNTIKKETLVHERRLRLYTGPN